MGGVKLTLSTAVFIDCKIMCLGRDGQGFPCNSPMSDCQSALVKQPPEGSTLTDSPDFFCLLLSCKKTWEPSLRKADTREFQH